MFFKLRIIISIEHDFVLKTKGVPFEFYQNLTLPQFASME